MKEKIIFFGTSEIAVPFLKSLLKEELNIVALVTQPDRPHPSPIKTIALSNNLPIIQPERLKWADLAPFSPDLGVLVSYGQIINPTILKSLKYGILNIHFSLLPKYRGASPVQETLLNADKQAGVTLMKLSNKMDTGPIVAQESLIINGEDNYLSLIKKLSNLGTELISKNITNYINNKIKLKTQDEKLASYSKIIKREYGEIKLIDNPKKIIQKLKAYTPWPGIYFFWKNKRFKIKKAHLDEQWKLSIDIIQPEGKREMDFEEFKRGYQDFSF